jgi:hypothetical protein
LKTKYFFLLLKNSPTFYNAVVVVVVVVVVGSCIFGANPKIFEFTTTSPALLYLG